MRTGKYSRYILGVGLGIFCLVRPTSASYFPIALSSAGVTASTVAAVIINQPTIANTGFNVNNSPSISNTGFNVNNNPNVILQQSTVLGASVTFQGAQPISVLYQPGSTVLATSGTITGALPAGTNALGTMAITTLYQPGSTVFATSGTITGSLPAGTNALGTVQPGNTPNTEAWLFTMSTDTVQQATAWNVVSTNTVVSGGVNIVQPGSEVLATSGTITGALPAGTNALGTVGVTTLYQPGSTVMATSGTITGALPTGTNQIGQVNLVQPGSEVLATSGTITGALPTGTNNIGTVTGSTMTINNPSGVSLNVNITGGAAITSNFTSNTTAAWNISPFPGQGQVIAGIGPSGLPQAFRVDIDSNIYEIQQVLVSSVTTFPNPQPNGSSTTAMGDPYGRAVTVAGAPTSVWLTTAPSTSGAGFMVLVASPTGTLFTHVCGCMFTNTSATAVQATIYPSGGVVNPNVVLQLVAGDTRGIWPGCDKPFLNTTAGGVEISAKISAAVSSISGYCQYIQNQTP